eukprot:1069830-Pleurochrysis_carterae.AAC.1
MGASAGAGAGRVCAVAQAVREGAQRAVAAIRSGAPRARGAERERSASTHATRVEIVKRCM